MQSPIPVRRLALAAVFVGALALAPAVAAAQGPQDFVTGGGHHSSPDTQFTISAHSGPAGQDPKGTLSFKTEGQARIRAEVTCLIVSGNRAIATATYIDPATGRTQLVVMEAVDNGEPGTAPAPDLLRFSFAPFIRPVAGSPGCFLPVLPPVPVTQGNIVVRDA